MRRCQVVPEESAECWELSAADFLTVATFEDPDVMYAELMATLENELPQEQMAALRASLEVFDEAGGMGPLNTPVAGSIVV